MAFRTNISLVLALFLTLASCSQKAVVQSTLSKPEPARFDNLRDSVIQIAALAKGHVGVSAMILETAETVAALNPRDHFPMQSVYKLPISMAVMQQVDAGKIKLEQKVAVTKSDFVRAGQHSPIRDRNPDGAEITVSELIRFAIAESDGTASDVLMKLAGGSQAVQKYLTDLRSTI
jgi:beta-lactamase class A